MTEPAGVRKKGCVKAVPPVWYALLLTAGLNVLFFGLLGYSRQVPRETGAGMSGRVTLLPLDELPPSERRDMERFLEEFDPSMAFRSDSRYGYAAAARRLTRRFAPEYRKRDIASYFGEAVLPPPPSAGRFSAERSRLSAAPEGVEPVFAREERPDYPYLLCDGRLERDASLPEWKEDQLKKLSPSMSLRLTRSGDARHGFTRYEVIRSSGNAKLDEELGLRLSKAGYPRRDEQVSEMEIHFRSAEGAR